MSKCESNVDELIVPDSWEFLERFRQGSQNIGTGAVMSKQMFLI